MHGARWIDWIARTLMVIVMTTTSAIALDYPAPRQATWIVKDFRFTTGETLSELKLHYATLGNPDGEPVLVLHGTTGAGSTMLNPSFAGELFGAGQPLDATKYFIILPDALGAGKSSKPSDGLRTRFPRFSYDDQIAAHHRLVTEALGIKHLRLVIGNSMGGMHAWMWAVTYPDMMDAVVPMGSLPTQMSSRNWMLRRMIIDSIKNDPDYNGGNYSAQPKAARTVMVYFGIATNGGTIATQLQAPTRALADKLLQERMAAPFSADANDIIYLFDASRDYDPEPGLERVTAAVLAINSADDERNPPETGLMERGIRQLKNGRQLLIPASTETRGHGTTGNARFWKEELRIFLASVPRRSG